MCLQRALMKSIFGSSSLTSPLKLHLPLTFLYVLLNHWVQLVLWGCVVGMRPFTLILSNTHSCISEENQYSLYRQPSTTNNSSARGGALWAFPPSMLGFLLAWSHICSMQSHSHLSSCVQRDCRVQKTLFCSSSKQSPALRIFQLQLSPWSWSPKGGGVIPMSIYPEPQFICRLTSMELCIKRHLLAVMGFMVVRGKNWISLFPSESQCPNTLTMSFFVCHFSTSLKHSLCLCPFYLIPLWFQSMSLLWFGEMPSEVLVLTFWLPGCYYLEVVDPQSWVPRRGSEVAGYDPAFWW